MPAYKKILKFKEKIQQNLGLVSSQSVTYALSKKHKKFQMITKCFYKFWINNLAFQNI